jgi:hypothetical protein
MRTTDDGEDGPCRAARCNLVTQPVDRTMRRAFFLVIPLAGVAAVLAGDDGPPPGRPETPAVSARPNLQYQGVASCAAAACHNGNGPRGSVGSEYTTWMAYDPHSRAHSVLSEPRSLLIVKNYRGLKTVQEARPGKDVLCVSCHVLPGFDNLGRHERFSAADGVGCEACHGPAEKWLTRHYREEWKALAAADRQALGMTDTRDVLARAETCVGCHVGRGDADVNHDLIAAGHPRLRFEYASYLARYPRHWRLADERRRYADFDARAWEVGQLASAAAALELLRERATRPGAPWPEFAEHECSACHHDLQEPSDHQERGFAGRRPGSPPWGTWYYPLLPALARVKGGTEPEAIADIRDLHKLMARRAPDPAPVARQAERAAASLHRWAAERNGAVTDGKRLDALLALLARQDDLVKTNWDGAAQLYLGVESVVRGRQNVTPHRSHSGVTEALQDLRRQLEVAFPRGRESVYDSPSRFDPNAVQRRLESVRLRLD